MLCFKKPTMAGNQSPVQAASPGASGKLVPAFAACPSPAGTTTTTTTTTTTAGRAATPSPRHTSTHTGRGASPRRPGLANAVALGKIYPRTVDSRGEARGAVDPSTEKTPQRLLPAEQDPRSNGTQHAFANPSITSVDMQPPSGQFSFDRLFGCTDSSSGFISGPRDEPSLDHMRHGKAITTPRARPTAPPRHAPMDVC
ncbi:unnamed protein product [Arctogadus glacialis]